ncbi:MAG: heme-binding domain-containing protein [Candidatus Binatia bacterium]
MKNLKGRTLLGLGVLFGLVQLVPVDRTNPAVESDVAAPGTANGVLRRACYDCHSNETFWPWYSQVAPVSWLLASDVREGRRELNFSLWNTYDPKRRAKKLKETVQEVRDGDMPPWYYVIMHSEAKLSGADRAAIERWVAEAMPGAPPARAE